MKSLLFITFIAAFALRNVCGRIIPEQDETLEQHKQQRNDEIQEFTTRSSDCSVKLRGGFKDPAPLLIKPGTTEFYPFTANGDVVVEKDKTVELHCTKSFASPLSGRTLTAHCVGGTTFKINDKEYDITQILCSSWPTFVAKKSGDSCNGGTTLIHVGFQLEDSRLLKQYEVCFNEDEEVTRYVHHTLAAGSNYYANNVDRISFTTAGFFDGKNVDKLYTQAVQMDTIEKALGGDSAQFFDLKKNVFLARGHMGAKADFVYSAEQRATFLFINAAPQWQTFNAGNWARVEDSVRAWGTKQKKDLECWTGVWGVTTLPNSKDKEIPLYLAYDYNGNGLIPVPKLYFRVVIEPATNKGIVLIGVNNPHISLAEIKRDYVICTDVSDEIDWVTWKKTDISAGYSYACEVPEFRKKVTHLPEFSVSGLLV